jgi:hypothetical protein
MLAAFDDSLDHLRIEKSIFVLLTLFGTTRCASGLDAAPSFC